MTLQNIHNQLCVLLLSQQFLVNRGWCALVSCTIWCQRFIKSPSLCVENVSLVSKIAICNRQSSSGAFSSPHCYFLPLHFPPPASVCPPSLILHTISSFKSQIPLNCNFFHTKIIPTISLPSGHDGSVNLTSSWVNQAVIHLNWYNESALILVVQPDLTTVSQTVRQCLSHKLISKKAKAFCFGYCFATENTPQKNILLYIPC